jgi:hypothetical protein
VIHASALLSLLTLAAPAPGPGESRPLNGTQFAQVRIQQHVLIRMPPPVRIVPPPPPRSPAAMNARAFPPPPISWDEKKADKCLKLATLAGAAGVGSGSVDLLLSNGKRLRAKLGSECPALDFYRGFYVKPTADGMICASRDTIRARSGSECRIKDFKTLVPSR